MKRYLTGAAGAALIAATAVTAAPAQAATNFLVMMDVSNSMWGQIDNRPKIEIARAALDAILADLGGETQVGLMAYGHRKKDDCQDVQMLVPFGAGGAEQVRASIAGLQPTGKTPIAYSLEQSLGAFEGRLEDNNSIVLISDGIETCDGDPCSVAASLRERGVNLRVHVVGFDVDEEAKAQLGCIAEKGGGEYYDAGNAAELNEVLTQVRQVAEAPAEVMTDATQVAQVEPEMVEIFFDDFESDTGEVAGHWTVENPDPEAYIAEAGELLLLSSQAQRLADGNISNLLLLNEALPRGDWTLTARLTAEFQTAYEDAFFGIYDSPENFVVGILQSSICGHWSDRICGHFTGVKKSPRDESTFTQNFYQELFTTEGYDVGVRLSEFPGPIQIRLKKQGRSYTFGILVESYVEHENPESPTNYTQAPYGEWFDLETFTILRQNGQVALGLKQREDHGGESVVLFDWVKIEAPK